MQGNSALVTTAVDCWKTLQNDPEETSRSISKVAADLGVTKSSLSNRLSGSNLSRSDAHAYRQSLTPSEELVIVDYIRRLQELHHPATASLIR